MEFCAHSPIPYAINLQLKDQARTLNLHIQRKIQVVKLHTLCCGKFSEQALRYGIEIGSKCAHVDKALAIGVWCSIRVACYQVVFNYEGLARSEVACVVEGYGL
jgi:hypothetical protein